jgi:hypothetical protein
MRQAILIAWTAVGAACRPTVPSPQALAPEHEVIRAAVVHVRTVSLRSLAPLSADSVVLRLGNLPVDKRIARQWVTAVERDAAVRVIDARSDCENPVKTSGAVARGLCYLPGARLYLEVERPTIRDTVSIRIYGVLRQTAKEMVRHTPFTAEAYDLALVKDLAGWRVVSSSATMLMH